jgi:hypothetical protein
LNCLDQMLLSLYFYFFIFFLFLYFSRPSQWTCLPLPYLVTRMHCIHVTSPISCISRALISLSLKNGRCHHP